MVLLSNLCQHPLLNIPINFHCAQSSCELLCCGLGLVFIGLDVDVAFFRVDLALGLQLCGLDISELMTEEARKLAYIWTLVSRYKLLPDNYRKMKTAWASCKGSGLAIAVLNTFKQELKRISIRY